MKDNEGKFLLNQAKYIGQPEHEYAKFAASQYGSVKAANAKANATANTVAAPAINPITKFFDTIGFKWQWIIPMAKHLFGVKNTFVNYVAPDTGIYAAAVQKDPNAVYSNPSVLNANNDPNSIKSNNISIGVVADWASYTPEAKAVAIEMMAFAPDYTIHLGDTYYTGEVDEIDDNYIGDNALWKRGTSGSFSLLGNHEMYAKGVPYFSNLLSAAGPLGIKDFTAKTYKGQNASYFCLQTDFWNVVGLDTGYNSVGVPFLKPNPASTDPDKSKADCHLDPGLVTWLSSLNLATDTRGIILMSHHQYFSAYEEEFYAPGVQLQPFIGNKTVLWIWGHEHRWAIYGKWAAPGGITAYGRCIGNGGMPVELKRTTNTENGNGFAAIAGNRNLVLCDKRLCTTIDDVKLGYNGYTIINLQNQKATISYYTSAGPAEVLAPAAAPSSSGLPQPLVREYWMTNNGVLTGYISKYLETPDFTTYNALPITAAVL